MAIQALFPLVELPVRFMAGWMTVPDAEPVLVNGVTFIRMYRLPASAERAHA